MKWKEYSLDELIHIKHGYAFKGEFFSEEPTDDILLTPGNFAIYIRQIKQYTNLNHFVQKSCNNIARLL